MGKSQKKTGEGVGSKKGWETIWVECSRGLKNGGKCGRWDQKYIKSDEAARLRKSAYICTECRIMELEEVNRNLVFDVSGMEEKMRDMEGKVEKMAAKMGMEFEMEVEEGEGEGETGMGESKGAQGIEEWEVMESQGEGEGGAKATASSNNPAKAYSFSRPPSQRCNSR